MAEYFADMRDIRFTLFEQVGLDRVLALPRFEGFDTATVQAVMDEAYKLAKNQLAPMNEAADRQGSTYESSTGKVTVPQAFHESYELYCGGGWLSLARNPEFGGQGMPYVLHLATHDLFFGSCLSFCLSSLLTTGAAHLIEAFGTEQLRQQYVEKMYTGQWAGTMCLTEAGAGSDVGACKTRAIKQGEHYLIEGEKIFITYGEHDLTDNICHAVLARIEGAPAGSRGISLFAVPKYRLEADGSCGPFNDVRCSGIEHKLGIHGSPTCSVVFGENGDCHGYLLGEENKGLRAMFQMMNEARIDVGLQGAALANAAYQYALQYAAERKQGKDLRQAKDPAAKATPIINHPDVRQMLLWQKAICEGTRSLLLRTGIFEDLAHHAGSAEERESNAGLVELLTPVCKAFSTDMGFRSVELSLQTLGGYGYVSEYPVEQYLRDIKITSIYEGTNGIQAMDLVGRKLPAKGGASFKAFLSLVGQLLEQHADHPALAAEMKRLATARDALVDASQYFAAAAKSDPFAPLLNATDYLELFGHVTVGWLLLERAAIAYPTLQQICQDKDVAIDDDAAVAKLCEQDDEAKFYDGKVKVAKFFAHRSLTLCPAKAEAIKSGDQTPLTVTF